MPFIDTDRTKSVALPALILCGISVIFVVRQNISCFFKIGFTIDCPYILAADF